MASPRSQSAPRPMTCLPGDTNARPTRRPVPRLEKGTWQAVPRRVCLGLGSRSSPSFYGVAHARVTGAKVTGARVTGARVTGARVTGARVTGARVTGGFCWREGHAVHWRGNNVPCHAWGASGRAEVRACAPFV